MAATDLIDLDATRALQESLRAREANLAAMQRHGAYSLMKVVARERPVTSEISGYITLLPGLSGRTPRQMELLLGLRDGDLASGANLYRLLRLPELNEFLPRGYSHMVDGGFLKPGLTQDSAGYRPGEGAWQVVLIKPIPAVLVRSLALDEIYEPGPHPDIAARYGRG